MWLYLCATLALADQPVALTKLPDAVRATLAKQWPDAKPVSAARDGHELEVVLAEGTRRFEAILKSDGTWVETEETVDPTTLPAEVLTALAVRGTVERAELRTRPDGRVDYEVVVTRDHKRAELHIDAAGAIEKVEKDEEEEDEGR
jgi:hypothetical protein